MFDAFWERYPRKVAKHAARQIWARMAPADREDALAAIGQHVAYWQACGTAREFIPHARTWLHQHRWEDEIEMPNVTPAAVEWWRTERGVLEKGAELGLQARPGEDMAQFKQRIVDAIVHRRAA